VLLPFSKPFKIKKIDSLALLEPGFMVYDELQKMDTAF
jgi:hypothetical protein